MDPRDFLTVARELAGAGTPAHNRTAISRLYYAVYNVACDLLQALGFDLDRGHAGHEVVRDRLRHSTVDRLIHVSAQLHRLHNVRVKADYWMRDPQPEHRATVERWLTNADSMISHLDAVLADSASHERIVRAVQTWERGRPGSRR